MMDLEAGELKVAEQALSRSLSFERLYNLGNYSNITFKDSFVNVPEKVALNERFAEKIYYLQMLVAERSYRRYVKLYAKLKTYSEEQYAEAITFIEQEKEKTLEELKTMLEGE
jgi:hypothetical protein